MSWCRWKELILIILNEQKQAKMIKNDSKMIGNDWKHSLLMNIYNIWRLKSKKKYFYTVKINILINKMKIAFKTKNKLSIQNNKIKNRIKINKSITKH